MIVRDSVPFVTQVVFYRLVESTSLDDCEQQYISLHLVELPSVLKFGS